MGEERARVQQFTTVDVLPSIRRTIGVITLRRQRVGGRAEPEDVQQQAFVIALPAVLDEAGLRPPAVRERGTTIARPVPVGAAVQPVGQVPDLALVAGVTVEERAHRQGTGEQERRVDRGQLAVPHATTGLDVEEVVEEALVAGGVGLRPLRTGEKVPEAFQGDLCGEVPGEHSTLDHDWNRGQRHADSGDADRRRRVRLVPDQSIVRVGFMQVVEDRGELQQAQLSLGGRSMEVVAARRLAHDWLVPFGSARRYDATSASICFR